MVGKPELSMPGAPIRAAPLSLSGNATGLKSKHREVTTLCYLDNLLAPLRVTNAGGIIPACEST